MSGGIDMNSVIMITQFFFTLVIGMYFFTKLRNEKSDSEMNRPPKVRPKI